MPYVEVSPGRMEWVPSAGAGEKSARRAGTSIDRTVPPGLNPGSSERWGSSTRSTSANAVEAHERRGDGRIRVSGLAVPYGVPTEIGNDVVETIAPGAFRDSLNVESRLPLLVGHDLTADPIGVAIDWDERADGLHGTWELGTSARALEVGRLLEDGLYRFLSIRFRHTQDGATWTRDEAGRTHVTINRGRIREVSLVHAPAYITAGVRDVRTAAPSAFSLPVDLGLKLGAPHLASAITGTPEEIRTACDLVRLHVETLGSGAGTVLEQIALATEDEALRINLARASSALAGAAPGRLDRVWLNRLKDDEIMAQSRARRAAAAGDGERDRG